MMESTYYIMALADQEPGQIFPAATLGRAKRYATVNLLDTAVAGQAIVLRQMARDSDGNFIRTGRVWVKAQGGAWKGFLA